MGAGLRGRASVAAAGIAFGMGVAARVAPPRSAEADLRGTVALVTGGSRGLGLALSRELHREGCRLAICARDETGLEEARADLESRGAEVLAVPCDVADPAQVAAMVEAVTRHYGQIDILVNNAGNHCGRAGRVADPRRLRASDGHQFLGSAQPDAGGAAWDAGAGDRAYRQHYLDRWQDRRAALTAIHLREVCRGRSFRGITGGVS